MKAVLREEEKRKKAKEVSTKRRIEELHERGKA